MKTTTKVCCRRACKRTILSEPDCRSRPGGCPPEQGLPRRLLLPLHVGLAYCFISTKGGPSIKHEQMLARSKRLFRLAHFQSNALIIIDSSHLEVLKMYNRHPDGCADGVVWFDHIEMRT